MAESPSYAYYEFPDQIMDRLSYGENHPERKRFFKLLEDAQHRTGHELTKLEKLVNFIEEKVNPSKEYPNDVFTYLGIEDIEPNTGQATFRTMLGKDILSKSNRFYRGNIVFTGLRPYLNKAHLVKIDEGIGSAELFVIQPKEELVVEDFLLKYLLSDFTLKQTKWILTGSSYPRLNPEDFKNLKIIRPTKEKQKQILHEIEPLEGKARQKEEAIKRLVDKCRNLVLEKLRIEMPFPATFKPTIHDFYADWAERNSERLDFIFHHPWMDKIRILLSSLNTVKLKTLIHPHIRYGITASGKEKGTIPFINIENLRTDGRLRTKEIRYIDSAGEKHLVHQGDILLSRSRLVGVCVLVTEKEDGFSFGSYILRLKIRQGSHIPPDYIVSFLNSDLGQAQIRMLETGAFGKNINTRQVKDIQIPLPDSPNAVDQIVSETHRTWKDLDNTESQTELLWSQSRSKFAELLQE